MLSSSSNLFGPFLYPCSTCISPKSCTVSSLCYCAALGLQICVFNVVPHGMLVSRSIAPSLFYFIAPGLWCTIWSAVIMHSTSTQLSHSFFFLSFQGQNDPHLVDKIMNDLDSNKDNEVDFNEFMTLVATLTVACNDFFEEQLEEGF